jgi:hypothetical protein
MGKRISCRWCGRLLVGEEQHAAGFCEKCLKRRKRGAKIPGGGDAMEKRLPGSFGSGMGR